MDLHAKYPFRWRPYSTETKMEQLSDMDKAVWKRFITSDPERFIACAYNVEVDIAAPTLGIPPDAYFRNWRYLNAPRVDVIGFDGKEIWIIECKPKLNAYGIGQVQCYDWFFRRRYAPTHPVKRAICYAKANANWEIYCDMNNIELLKVDMPEEFAVFFE